MKVLTKHDIGDPYQHMDESKLDAISLLYKRCHRVRELDTGTFDIRSTFQKGDEEHIGYGYGELMQKSLSTVIACMMKADDCLVRNASISKGNPILSMNSSSRFIDLGSGSGRACIHVYLQSKTNNILGIEKHEGRLASSQLLLSDISQLLHDPSVRSHIKYINGSFNNPLHVHHVLQSTHIYAYDVVFTDDTKRALAKTLMSPQAQWILFASYISHRYTLGSERINRYGARGTSATTFIRWASSQDMSYVCTRQLSRVDPSCMNMSQM